MLGCSCIENTLIILQLLLGILGFGHEEVAGFLGLPCTDWS